jgi:hypothetical protein
MPPYLVEDLFDAKASDMMRDQRDISEARTTARGRLACRDPPALLTCAIHGV